MSAAADVEELAEREPNFMATIVLDVRVLVAPHLEVGLAGIGVLAHRHQVVWTERGQVPEIRDGHILIVLFHVEITDIERAARSHEGRPVGARDPAAIVGRRRDTRRGVRIDAGVLDMAGPMPVTGIQLVACGRNGRELSVEFTKVAASRPC